MGYLVEQEAKSLQVPLDTLQRITRRRKVGYGHCFQGRSLFGPLVTRKEKQPKEDVCPFPLNFIRTP